MEGGVEDLAVVRPFLAAEADEAFAFELPYQWVGFVAVEEIGARDENLADELRIGDGQPSGGSEPEQESGACKTKQSREESIRVQTMFEMKGKKSEGPSEITDNTNQESLVSGLDIELKLDMRSLSIRGKENLGGVGG